MSGVNVPVALLSPNLAKAVNVASILLKEIFSNNK